MQQILAKIYFNYEEANIQIICPYSQLTKQSVEHKILNSWLSSTQLHDYL